MPTATLTSKGQLTLPKRVRERLGLHRGDRIEFLIEEDGTVRLRPLALSVRELAGILSVPRHGATTLEEMDEGIATVLAEDEERIRSGG